MQNLDNSSEITGKEKKHWNSSSHSEFYEYYKSESEKPDTIERFKSISRIAEKILNTEQLPDSELNVADIGCGAGTQSLMWADQGHNVYGLDVNEPLVTLAKERAVERHLDIDFRTGSATELPWADATIDICLVPELLEHVAEWKTCLNEFVRILKPGGILILTTCNKLCPIQNEFNLPLYSWYPHFIKRYCERLTVTTRPQLANYATYPAVNWFSYFSLRAYLSPRGLKTYDRFDFMLMKKKPLIQKIGKLVLSTPGVRLLGHMFTPYTVIAAIKLPTS